MFLFYLALEQNCKQQDWKHEGHGATIFIMCGFRHTFRHTFYLHCNTHLEYLNSLGRTLCTLKTALRYSHSISMCFLVHALVARKNAFCEIIENFQCAYIIYITVNFQCAYIIYITVNFQCAYITYITVNFQCAYITYIKVNFQCAYITYITVNFQCAYITYITVNFQCAYIIYITVNFRCAYIRIEAHAHL